MESRPWANQPRYFPEDDEHRRNRLYRTRSYGTTPSDSEAESSSDDGRDEAQAQITKEKAAALIHTAQEPVERQELPVKTIHRIRSRDMDVRPQRKYESRETISRAAKVALDSLNTLQTGEERSREPDQVVRKIHRLGSLETIPCTDLFPKKDQDDETICHEDGLLPKLKTRTPAVSRRLERDTEPIAKWTTEPSIYREREDYRILAENNRGLRPTRMRSVGWVELIQKNDLSPGASKPSNTSAKGNQFEPKAHSSRFSPEIDSRATLDSHDVYRATDMRHSAGIVKEDQTFQEPPRSQSPDLPQNLRRHSKADLQGSSGKGELITDNRTSPPKGAGIKTCDDAYVTVTKRADSRFKALRSDNSEIRLIKLYPEKLLTTSQVVDPEVRCSLFVTTLDKAPTFEALSYTWGDPSTKRKIQLDDEPFGVTENLEMALQNLRHKRSTGNNRYFWIDAICINQADENERSAQVSKMRLIYAKAKRVVVWLGGHANNSEEAFSLLKEIYLRKREKGAVEKLLKSPIKPKHLQGIASLFSREYFWRIWVIQEIYFAEALTIQCGTSSMDWDAIIVVQDMLKYTYHSLMTDICENRRSLSELQPALSFRGPKSLLLDRTDDQTDSAEDLHLFDAILMHRLKHATDPKDKIYALVGLTTARDDPEFVIDYSQSVQQIYINTVKYIIRTSGSLDIICTKTKGTDKTDFPSWVPNLGSSGVNCPVPHRRASRKGDYTASKDRPCKAKVYPDMGILTAAGIRLGTIKKIGQPTGMQRSNHHYQAFKTFQDWHTFLSENLSASSISKPCDWSTELMYSPSNPLYSQHDNHCAQFPESFARLILSDIIDLRDVGNQPRSHYLCTIIAANHYLNTIIAAIVVQARRMYPQLELCEKLQAAALLPTPRNSLKDWHRIIAQLFFKRKIFIMDNDTIGLAEEAIEEGDVVAVLFGCSLPVILRKVQGKGRDESWVYVSDALVVGYMYGAALDELKAGKRKEEFFLIR